MKIVVIGSSGLIGSKVVGKLRENPCIGSINFETCFASQTKAV